MEKGKEIDTCITFYETGLICKYTVKRFMPLQKTFIYISVSEILTLPLLCLPRRHSENDQQKYQI